MAKKAKTIEKAMSKGQICGAGGPNGLSRK
jgi:hypothetical protein